ncbi:phosphate ABC transporter permease PstA [Pseudoteredinibacter isoporae]|uniref:phosphate ABC transporter permease PstA n=1 Tax=Pseudoteredinibacter isoporae TaxID=570281 RepID=UPI0031055FB5
MPEFSLYKGIPRFSLTKSRLIHGLIAAAVLLALCVFGFVLSDIAIKGWRHIDFSFLTENPLDSGRAGGVLSILVSTLAVVLICLFIAIPLGVATALWLAEFSDSSKTRPIAAWLRRLIHLLSGIPSIVIGLFGFVFFCQILGLGYSLLAGGLSLACMALPLIIGTMEQDFRSLPSSLRQASSALAISHSAFIFHILLPVSAPALITATVLSIGRSLAETAVLLFTSGYVTRMPESVLDPGRVMSVHIFDLSMNVTGGDNKAYASALVLTALIIALNFFTKIVIARFKARL